MPVPGDLRGPFRLISPLGKGAMGEVWRARDERLDRDVALKVLPPEDAGNLERRARQLREAKAAAAIKHPNVVTLFDIISHDGDDILVMELVEGRTLADALRKDGPPTLERGLRWIEGIADALATAHARGVLHRDIKAANIMIASDATSIKVLDFGLAKLRDDAPVIVVERGKPLSLPPSMSGSKLALGETLLSAGAEEPPMRHSALELESYKTHHGQLLGTPIYMAPEQIAGDPPDERTEVFSVGIVAYEVLAGKPPYAATSFEDLFAQIVSTEPPPIEGLPKPVAEALAKALAKDPAHRYPTMTAFRDAIIAQRRQLFSPRARRWPLFAAIAAALVAGGLAVGIWRGTRPAEIKPGDALVERALAEYDTFYNDKSLSSLRGALAVAPDHPRANAYLVLFGGASKSDEERVVAAVQRTTAPTGSRDRTLLATAAALVQRGPRAARDVLATAPRQDRELAFWAAEMDYRAGNYVAARDEYATLLTAATEQLRGRIYDHYSSILLYLDEPTEALRIGTLYRDAFPGEADAVGVYATTLAAAGKLDDAVVAAEQALSLAEGEDTLAGLAKVVALAGDRARAIELYQRSLDRAPTTRRPIRRAALGLLQLAAGQGDTARATVAPCLPGGADATVRERGACLFVAALVDPLHADDIARELDALSAAATPTRPAYGAPASLARLVRARGQFFGGGCLVQPAPIATDPPLELAASYAVPLDFYAAYHVPFFATYAPCEHAALLAARGDKASAVKILEAIAARAPGRTWILETADRYR